ncbi:MAG: hypothetical protein CMH31_00020 [Micavibrio sp.]|nr:hypothetical protein [Micavibrio sp.]|tara:strand:+ start:233 stop:406 length:174 start_codon:yes stop_codon:yes gene_type:complete
MRYLTTKEASEYLGFKSVKTLERWRKNEDSPPYFQQGRVILYPLDGLIEWIENRITT